MDITDKVVRRFWKYAQAGNKDECWEWQGVINWLGYGCFQLNYKMVKAHRVSWEIHKGEIPPGLKALHRCNNRRCINPHHLYLGTQSDNIKQAVRDGTLKPMQGESHPRHKLTTEQVLVIRASHNLSYRELASKYHVSRITIGEIMTRRSWKHV